jgi:hypothetical protein
LEPLSIQEDFLRWGLDYLRQSSEQEVVDRRAIYASAERAYQSTQKQLDELLNVRLRGLIDDDEFDRKRVVLQKERNRLKEKLEDTEGRADRWLELAQNVLHFSFMLSQRFNVASVDEKRVILETLGSNLLLKDKKLHFEPVAPYCYLSNTSEIANWRATVNDVRTFFLLDTEDLVVPRWELSVADASPSA